MIDQLVLKSLLNLIFTTKLTSIISIDGKKLIFVNESSRFCNIATIDLHEIRNFDFALSKHVIKL